MEQNKEQQNMSDGQMTKHVFLYLYFTVAMIVLIGAATATSSSDSLFIQNKEVISSSSPSAAPSISLNMNPTNVPTTDPNFLRGSSSTLLPSASLIVPSEKVALTQNNPL